MSGTIALSPTTGYRPMQSDCADAAKNFATWNAATLAAFFQSKGLDATCLQQHKITGALAPLLTDDDLKEMGILVVGDRLLFRQYLQELSRRQRFVQRIQAHWQGQERLFFSTCEERVWTLGGLFPVDPATYKLTATHLKIKRVQPARCGPFRLWCCGTTYASTTIDLSHVDDVDVTGVPAPCLQRILCCAVGKDVLQVESGSNRVHKVGNNKTVTLSLTEGQGESVANLILHQVEESQKMERS